MSKSNFFQVSYRDLHLFFDKKIPLSIEAFLKLQKKRFMPSSCNSPNSELSSIMFDGSSLVDNENTNSFIFKAFPEAQLIVRNTQGHYVIHFESQQSIQKQIFKTT